MPGVTRTLLDLEENAFREDNLSCLCQSHNLSTNVPVHLSKILIEHLLFGRSYAGL